MARRVYPDEAVVFEVIGGFDKFHGFKHGTHVEGSYDPDDWMIHCYGPVAGMEMWHPRDSQWMKPRELRPLTPAARAMLALVKGK